MLQRPVVLRATGVVMPRPAPSSKYHDKQSIHSVHLALSGSRHRASGQVFSDGAWPERLPRTSVESPHQVGNPYGAAEAIEPACGIVSKQSGSSSSDMSDKPAQS